MNSFLDTSVLVPAFLADHPHHAASLAVFVNCEPKNASCASHSLAELYATLTRIPAPHRASPGQALKCVEEVAARFRIINLDTSAILTAIRNAASENVAGGTTYDFLIATCAVQSGADRVYCWNNRHFERFGPNIAAKLVTPTSI